MNKQEQKQFDKIINKGYWYIIKAEGKTTSGYTEIKHFISKIKADQRNKFIEKIEKAKLLSDTNSDIWYRKYDGFLSADDCKEARIVNQILDEIIKELNER